MLQRRNCNCRQMFVRSEGKGGQGWQIATEGRLLSRTLSETALSRLALTLTVVLFLTAIPGAVMAAEEKGDGKRARGSWFTEAGFISGYGDASLDEGVYRTLLMMVHLGKDITHFIPALKNHRGTLSFFLEPQFNYVLKPAGEIEFGLGIGFQYAYPVTERISPYILVVTGPQLYFRRFKHAGQRAELLQCLRRRDLPLTDEGYGSQSGLSASSRIKCGLEKTQRRD